DFGVVKGLVGELVDHVVGRDGFHGIPGLSNTNASAWRSATQIAGGVLEGNAAGVRGPTDLKWVVAKILKVPLAGETGSQLPAGIELRPPLDWQHAKQFTEHDPEGAERLIELIRHSQKADLQAESMQPNE